MPISDDQLNRILQQQQAQLDAQMRLLETLTQQLNTHCSSSHAFSSTSCDAVASSIPEFYYDPDSGNTFLMWFKRWEDTFRIEFCKQDDAWKTRLLMRKLGSNEHARYADHILPKLPRELSFDETVAQLSEIFGESSSLFSIRYQCLNLVKRETDEYGALADIVNRECERFKLRSLTEDQFKCLIFIKALQSPQDAEIRTRLLTRLDQDPNITLRTSTDECKRLQNIRHDNQLIEQVNPNLTCSSINAITRLKAQKPRTSGNKPTTACWLCGDWHYVRFCPFKKHKCRKCNKCGHKEDHCPPNRTSQPKKKHRRPRHMVKSAESQSLSLVAAFQTDYDIQRKYVTIQINGIPARLQIDTASDITLVSRETYNLLGKPPIKPSKKIAKNASGGLLQLVGELQCEFSFNGNSCKGICYLTERPYLDLLGLDMLEKLGIMDIPINSICSVSCPALDTPIRAKQTGEKLPEKPKRKFAPVFQNTLGPCTKMKVHLPVKPDALKKSRGEGTTEEILERFLLIYRSTPNPQTTNGVSPAEALLGRKIRTHFDSIRPTPALKPQGNVKMEKQFNRRHGAKRRLFTVGQRVLAMDYRGKHPTWTAGRIVQKKGNVVYEVSVGSEVWVRHANQLKPTCIANNETRYRLPLDVLLDTFEINIPETDRTVAVQTKDGTTSLLPRRWTNRKHKPVQRLQVNPNTRSYESAQGGGVSGI
ncbi:hypothetical protein MN116_000305 [Schistosoma mekongi]|uniref:DUF7083 domain-containing protein n=1 Tax=Schistosoma mekongi TaxID=38744 RepID=A0AAE2D0Y9_SCHME|nr:hypothetical protein MN116_000305 [Schistosoma mekongi]